MHVPLRFKKPMLFLAFMVLLGTLGVGAEALKHLYQVEIPLGRDNSESDQSKLTKKAFESLILKIGSADLLEKAAVRKALSDPDPYVTQLSYHQDADAQPIVKVSFNESLVERLLKEADGSRLPMPKERPLTLLWLVLEDAEGTHLVSSDTDPSLLAIVEQSFKQRALPLLLPLIDLVDSAAISVEAIRDKHFDSIRAASERYHPERIVLGALKQDADQGYVATWTLVPDPPPSVDGADPERRSDGASTASQAPIAQSWQSKAADQGLLLQALLEHLLHQGPSTHSVPTKVVPPVVVRAMALHVSGVSQAEDYAKIMQHLEQMPFLSKIRIQSIGADSMDVSLNTKLSHDQLVHALEKSQLLVPEIGAKPSLGELFFSLRGPE